MSVHRIKIESDSVLAVQTNPTWSGKIDLSRENGGVYFRAKPTGQFQFRSTEYTTIKEVADCEAIDIYMEEKCGEEWIERWRGRFTTYDVSFNENKCIGSVAPKTIDEYTCFFENWDVERVVSGAGSIVQCRPFAGTYEAGISCCTVTGFSPPAFPVCSTPANMCYDSTYSSSITGGLFAYTSCFHRVVGIGTPSTPPVYGSGWTHLSGDEWWRCPADDETSGGVFDQGRWFNDVLEYLTDQLSCGLTVRSHFFTLNNTHADPPANLAYDFASTYYPKIQIHQKSDIKRPDATDPAQSFVWKMSFKKLLEDMENMWQVFWKIDGSDLIIEHISYFEAASGLDVTDKNIKLAYGKREEGAPNEERFKWADTTATFSLAHRGYPIIYGDCGEGRKDRSIHYFSNDVYYIRATANPEEIADSGFCLLATQFLDSEYQTYNGNDPMGWVDIHENLFQHNRYFAEGNLNNADTSFASTTKTRKLEPFQIQVCCDDGFSPEDTIETLVGTAVVQKVTIDYFLGADANMVEIESNI